MVEDSPLMQERLRAMLDDMDGVHLVGQADDEAGAVNGIFQTLPDAVVLDLNLSHGSGMTVLWQIKQAYPHICVLVLTNWGDLQHHNKCKRLGANFFFDKSKHLEAFFRAVTDLAAKHLATECVVVSPDISMSFAPRGKHHV